MCLENNSLQVAFVGRSNVGKSSLIRAILGEVDIDVRVSSKPVSISLKPIVILTIELRYNKFKLPQKAWSALNIYKIVIQNKIQKVRPLMLIAAFNMKQTLTVKRL